MLLTEVLTFRQTYGNKLYETQALQNGGALNAGDDLTYTVGQSLVASLNGYLTNNESTTDNHVLGGATVIGILKIVPDSNSDELVYDQRI